MSTEQTTDLSRENLEQVLRDPLSMSDEDLQALVGGQSAQVGGAAGEEGDGTAGQTNADQKGENSGATPGTEAAAKGQTGQDGAQGAAADEADSVVQARDGKNIIPYQVLQQERENRIRAEQMVRELTSKLELDRAAIESGTASKSADLKEIVNDDLLEQLREEAPQVAAVMDSLIGQVKNLTTQLDATRPAAEEAEQAQRERQVQAVVSVEDAIAAIPKLHHLRAHDQAAFNDVAAIDAMLRAKPAWQDKPLPERFEAAVRMYEAANGSIELPGAPKQGKPPAQQPADTAARVEQAIAKAKASDSGPSTLSDIPGGQPAADTQADAMADLSAVALTERLMNMTPEQIEEQLARFAS